MNAKLPQLFRNAVAAALSVDYRVHPRIFRRRWLALLEAHAVLRREYPRLEAWLFPYTGFEQAKVDELLRLIAAAQKEASDGV